MQIFSLIPVALFITGIIGWINHVIWSIETLLGNAEMTINQGVVAIIGAIVPPLGAIHGVYLWFV